MTPAPALTADRLTQLRKLNAGLALAAEVPAHLDVLAMAEAIREVTRLPAPPWEEFEARAEDQRLRESCYASMLRIEIAMRGHLSRMAHMIRHA